MRSGVSSEPSAMSCCSASISGGHVAMVGSGLPADSLGTSGGRFVVVYDAHVVGGGCIGCHGALAVAAAAALCTASRLSTNGSMATWSSAFSLSGFRRT